MIYDFIVVGGGIAGSAISHFLSKYKTLLLDKDGLCSGASNAAGAFLFPKIGFNTKYTKFVNDAILYSFDFYTKLGIDTQKNGVNILPRDEKDKFDEYKKSFELEFQEKNGGFFFPDGGVLEPLQTCKKLTENVEFEIHNVKDIEKSGDYWIIDNLYKTKNIILCSGANEIIDIPYIKIRPVWGERIEIETDLKPEFHYHKNCSISMNKDGIVKIGATHKRVKENLSPNIEEADILIQKANEIMEVKEYKIHSMKAGLRAGSVDFFPIIGKIIDSDETLILQPDIKKGRLPKKIVYKEGLYILNGGGGRGFSNYVLGAKILRDYLVDKIDIPNYLNSDRHFIKWARKLG